MTTSCKPDVRRDFRRGAEAFAAVVRGIGSGSWERAALGVWNVRDLVGHTSRALLTVESYLDTTELTDNPAIRDAVGYLRAATAALADPAAVAERGRQAGAALGGDPAATVSALADRVLQLVECSDDDARVGTPVGTMTLTGYLPTRTFELAVHTLDLAAATGMTAPAELGEPLAASLQLAADLAVDAGRVADVLLAVTGRRALPDGFSLL